MWGRFLKSIITSEPEGNDSPAVDFFTNQIIPCEFDDTSLKIVLYAQKSVAEQIEDNFGVPSGNVHYHYAMLLINWIREEQKNFEDRLIRIEYFLIDRFKSEVERDAYTNMKSYMSQLRTNVNSSILGEEFFEEVKRQKVAAFDSLIARKAPTVYKQSNKLTRAKVRLTMTQKKTLNYLIWKYQNTDLFQTNLWGEVSISVKVKELQDCGCGANIKQILKSLTSLGKDTWMEYIDENHKYVSAALFTRFDAEEDSKVINVTFSPTMTSFVNKLATYKEYTLVDRDAQAAMKTYAAARMYELCSQFRYSEKYIFQIKDKELRAILNCEEKYPDPNDFKRYVLQSAKTELERLYEEGKSDLYFDFAVKDKKASTVNIQPKYKRKEVASWIFSIKRGVTDFQYVKNDSLAEKKKFVDKAIQQILTCYITDEDAIETLMNKARKMDDKDRFAMARELQSSISELSSKGEVVIHNIMDKYRFKT